MKQNAVVVLGLGLSLSVALASPLGAEEETLGYVKPGFYVGAALIYNNVSGDFDDTQTLETPAGLIDMPEVDNGPGFGVLLGHRWGRVSLELGYQRTSHDTRTSHATFQDLGRTTSDAAYNVVDLNVKIDVFAWNRLRPYILFGAGVPWLTIDEDKLNNDNEFEDVTFVGYCLNLGGGVAYYFRPQWAVTAGGIYRWNWFTSAGDGGLDEDPAAEVFSLTVGVAYTF
ncbi:MAG: porin family protein [Planctomycetes bacterium]|nr:porin family protein [Planctomycetota bacterium]